MFKSYEIYDDLSFVGNLSILSHNYFSFKYSSEWLQNDMAFNIDPQLAFNTDEQFSNGLWGIFKDISPDRWGKIIQNRSANHKLFDYEYMLGVSDYFRSGSIRIKDNNEFILKNTNIPKLTHLSEIENASSKLENEEYTQEDLRILFEAGSSIGGARPKASILHDNELYLAKFSSKNDEEQVILWEKTMLDLANIANLKVAKSIVVPSFKNGILLLKRFDRCLNDNNELKRLPFISAMTLLGANDMEQNHSYIDLADKLDSQNKQELFARMVFNGLFGNTDDHLRNHGLLYDRENKRWNLSPAYDLNPNNLEYKKQYHALNFIDNYNTPSLELFYEIKDFFDIDKNLFKEILDNMQNVVKQYELIAKKNGLKQAEINYHKENFANSDVLQIQDFVNKISVNNKIKKNLK